jgi:hypothetical protein
VLTRSRCSTAASWSLHERLTGRCGESLVLDHYLEVLAVKPGALLGATALARARSSGALSADHEAFWTLARRRFGDRDGTRAMIEVLLAHRQLPAEAVRAGLRACVAIGVVDPAVVVVEARRAAGERRATVVPIGTLARYDRPTPTIEAYDQLLEEAQ